MVNAVGAERALSGQSTGKVKPVQEGGCRGRYGYMDPLPRAGPKVHGARYRLKVHSAINEG